MITIKCFEECSTSPEIEATARTLDLALDMIWHELSDTLEMPEMGTADRLEYLVDALEYEVRIGV